MTDELKSVEAGEYTLVARLIKGEYQGALWAGGKMDCQVQGGSIDEVWKKLSDELADRQEARVQKRAGAEPSAKEAELAFCRIKRRLSTGHKAMLRAHLRAPSNNITATQLAAAAGYGGYSAANLQYGLLGAMLFAEMPEELPRRADGSRIMTCVIASRDDQRETPEEQWIWKMRTHIVEGLGASRIL